MMYFENNGSVAIVFYRHSFSEIVRGCHKRERLIVDG
jgi:hypothetical protein